MNKIEAHKIKGVLNKVSETQSFFEDYEVSNGIDLYCYEKALGGSSMGLLIISENKKNCVNVPLGFKSYINMKSSGDIHYQSIATSQSLITSISNVFEINVILGFVKDVHCNFFESYLLLEKDKKFLCVNVLISELFSMGASTKYPVYIHKDIFKKRKMRYEPIKKRMQATKG